ncbi:MAG: hypothetical protein LC624_11195 [Halobacteriales archaeon]|nr:hypothetical protein [Halobacteriales archaeon]
MKSIVALTVAALAASGAWVGLGMASAAWSVVGEQLTPGTGYAVLMGDGADRFRLELANASARAEASALVLAPDGTRAAYLTLAGAERSAEVAAGQGAWLVFVYRAHDAQGLHSELRTDAGLVEVVDEQDLSAAQSGLVVEQHGSRVTFPENLTKGGFTAEVQARDLQGTLRLAALYLRVPALQVAAQAEAHAEVQADGDADTTVSSPPPAERPAPAPQPAPKPNGTGDPSGNATVGTHSAPPPPALKSCGEVQAGTPTEVRAPARAWLEVAADGGAASAVRIYGPKDELVGVLRLDDAHASARVQLRAEGAYVLLSESAKVRAALTGASCTVRELGTRIVTVATIHARAEVDQGAVQAEGMVAGAWMVTLDAERLNGDLVVTAEQYVR